MALNNPHNQPIETIILRPAQETDQENLFHWRNHTLVRQFSHSTDLIAWETHVAWFGSVIKNPDCALTIGEISGEPLGVVRYDFRKFDLQADEALLSIYLLPERIGHGYGPRLLQASSGWLRRVHPHIKRILADIQPENTPSIHAFMKAGYRLSGNKTPVSMARKTSRETHVFESPAIENTSPQNVVEANGAAPSRSKMLRYEYVYE
jgi:RimJ/RimL family protein N-acetyltransferase